MIDLHKLMVDDVSGIEINHDGNGGAAPGAMIWDRGGILKPRSSSFRATIDSASLPSPHGFSGELMV